MADRYVAHLRVYRITENEGTGRGDDKRRKSEDLNTTVKADSLEGLKKKVHGHMSLVEEVDLDG